MDCCECARNKPADKHGRRLQFSQKVVLWSLSQWTFGNHSLKALDSKQIVLVMKDHYSKWKKTISMSNKVVSEISSLFMDNRVIPYGIQLHVLLDDDVQFVSNFSERCATFWGQSTWWWQLFTSRWKDRQFALKRQQSPDCDCLWLIIILTGTFNFSRQRVLTAPRCITLRIWHLWPCYIAAFLVWWYSTPSRFYQLTQQRLHLHTHSKHYYYTNWRQCNKKTTSGWMRATTLQRWRQQKDSSCATGVTCQRAYVRQSSTNENLCHWATGDLIIQ